MERDNGRLRFATEINNEQLRRDAEKSRRILQSIGDAGVKEGEKIDNAMKNIGKTIASAFAVQQMASFTKSVVDVRSQIQSLEVSFKTLLGSEAKANHLFGELKEFAVKTPLQLGDLSKGAQTLLSFNVAADKVMPVLKAIGDISMGDSQKLQSLTLAFSQMSATGKLMGQDLLQMINAGFNPLSVISEKTGESIGKLKKRMEEGQITAQMVEDAFMSASQEGGKFAGMLEQQSKTLAGSISNLQGAWDDMLNDVGTKTEGVMSDAISLATYCVQHYEAFVNVLLSLAAAYGSYKAALIAVWTIEKSREFVENIRLVIMFRKELGLLTAVQQAFNTTALKNPYIILGAAIMGVITALVLFNKKENETQERIDKANETIKQQERELEKLSEKHDVVKEAQEEASKSTTEEISKIKLLSDIIHDNTLSLDNRKKALSQLQAIVPNYHASLDKEGKLHNDNTVAINKHIDSLKKLAIANAMQDKLTQAYSEKLTAEINKKTAKKQQKENDANLKEAKKELQKVEKVRQKASQYSGATIPGTLTGNEITREAEKKKKAAEKELEATNKTIRVAEEQIKKSDEIIEKLTDYAKENNISLTEGTTKKDNNAFIPKKDKKTKEKIDNTLIQEQYNEELKKQAKQSALDIRQAQIDGEQEGVEKYLKQNKLNYDRMIAQNEERAEEMKEALIKQRQKEWENQNPNATENQKNETERKLRGQITIADLTQQQRDQLAAYNKIANDTLERANRETLDKMLGDVFTYHQQRDKIAQKYTDKEIDLYRIDDNGNMVLRDGVTQGNIDELNRQMEEELKAIDEQFAQRQITYQVWCESIASMTLEELSKLLERTKKELEQVEKSGANGEDLAVARAKVNTLQDNITKETAKNNALSPQKRTIKDWKDLKDVLDDCSNSFKEMGEEIDGTVGKIISSVGEVASSTTSIINSIVQLMEISSQSISITATITQKAIKATEEASVILAIISATMKVARTISDLFNNDDKRQKEIDRLQQDIDRLQWELNNPEAVKIAEIYGSAGEQVKQIIDDVRLEMLQAINDTTRTTEEQLFLINSAFAKASKSPALMEKSVKKLVKAYANLDYSITKAIGEEKYNGGDELNNISQQIIKTQEQLDNAKKEKNPDSEAIKKYEQQLEELRQQAVAVVNDIMEEIIGGSSDDIAQQLGDAFIEAFASGEDAAKAWGDTVNDIVSDITKKMIIDKVLSPEIVKIFDEYKNKWYKDGEFLGFDNLFGTLEDFKATLDGLQEGFANSVETAPDWVKELFKASDATREGEQKGIANASQESVDELNGRATAIQGHTYSISENTKKLVSDVNVILQYVVNIDNNTETMANTLTNVRQEVKQVKDTIDDIALKGIKIKSI